MKRVLACLAVGCALCFMGAKAPVDGKPPPPPDSSIAPFGSSVVVIYYNTGNTIVLSDVRMRKLGPEVFLVGTGNGANDPRLAFKGKKVWANLAHVMQVTEYADTKDAIQRNKLEAGDAGP